jgi:hypothetical protein
MNSASGSDRKVFFLVAALILTVLGGAGVFGNDLGYTDALYQPDYTIVYAPPDGVLAEAGFQAGDSVLTVEGIPVTELGMYSRWPRELSRRPGESVIMVVDRDGEQVTGEIVYRQPPASSRSMQAGGLLVFLAFTWAGVLALFAAPSSPHAYRLALMGLAAGLAVQFPNAGSWNGLVEHVHMAAMLLWTILLFRFFLFFPRTKGVARARLTTLACYLPWAVAVGCLLLELVFHPRFYHTFGFFIGLLMFAYLILAVVAFVHGWVKTPREEMGPSGMGSVLAGMALAIAGVLFWMADALLMPNLAIPGSGWATTLMAAIPVGLFMGVRRAASGETISQPHLS